MTTRSATGPTVRSHEPAYGLQLACPKTAQRWARQDPVIVNSPNAEPLLECWTGRILAPSCQLVCTRLRSLNLFMIVTRGNRVTGSYSIMRTGMLARVPVAKRVVIAGSAVVR